MLRDTGFFNNGDARSVRGEIEGWVELVFERRVVASRDESIGGG